MEDEHDRMADEALEEADRIQEPSDDLKREIRETREDWESKQGQESVPGAVDPDKFHPDPDEEEQLPEPEYEEINPQAADASGGGESQSDDDDDS
jgi:hypothetical protein